MKKKKLLKKLVNKFLNLFNLQFKPKFPISDIDYLYLLWIVSIFDKAKRVPGHIIEIGVASGRNSILFGKLLKISSEKWSRKYYGFDTFRGYPKDVKQINPWLNLNAWKNQSCSKESVLKRIESNNFDSYCELIEGDCRETLKDFLENYSDNMMQKGCAVISLLYIDCNSYTAALESMKLVYPYLAPGGLIAVDEKIQGGETKALIEFAKLKNIEVRHDSLGCPAYLKKP